MILKELTPPIITEKLKVLMQRLPTNHPKRKQIEEKFPLVLKDNNLWNIT